MQVSYDVVCPESCPFFLLLFLPVKFKNLFAYLPHMVSTFGMLNQFTNTLHTQILSYLSSGLRRHTVEIDPNDLS